MKIHRSQITAIADHISAASLTFIGIVNLIILTLTFILALMNSNAKAQQDQIRCSGANLLKQFAKSAPGTLEKINNEAAKVPFGNTLLFKLEKEGIEPSYLFGTMHMTDPRIVTLPKSAEKAFKDANIVAIESTEILDPAKAQITLMSRPELTMFVDEKRLTDFMSEEDKNILRTGLAQRGMQLALIDRMKPWLLTGMLALPACEFARKQAGKPYLDLAIAQRAVAQSKELVGLETLLEQFNAMASLPMHFHVQGLVDTLKLGDRVNDVTETMIILYTQGKIGAVWPMLRAVSQNTGQADDNEDGYAKFEETMVNTRNRTMLKRSLPLLERGNAFIAVGALHLPGEQGLAKLYEKAGYKVTPLQ